MGNISRRDALKVIGAGSAAAVLAVSGVGKLVDALPTSTSGQTTSGGVGSTNPSSGDSNGSSAGLNPSEPLVVIVCDDEILGFQGTKELMIKDKNLAKKLFNVFGGGN
jgi:hypothetical protein